MPNPMPPKDERAERLAAQLRANLRRRKTQAREADARQRAGDGSTTQPGDDEPGR